MRYILLPGVALGLLLAGCQPNDADVPEPTVDEDLQAPQIAPSPTPEPEAPPAQEPMPEAMHEGEVPQNGLPSPPEEDAEAAQLWDRARDFAEQAQHQAEEAWRIGREEGGEAWEAARNAAAEAWVEAQEAWDAAQEYSGEAWSAGRDAAEDAWSDATAAWERLTNGETPEE